MREGHQPIRAFCPVSSQVDGKTNPKIQSIHLENFPVNKASFSADGEQVVATGMRNKLFYVYDMMEGKIIPVPRVRGQMMIRAGGLLSEDERRVVFGLDDGFLSLVFLCRSE